MKINEMSLKFVEIHLWIELAKVNENPFSTADDEKGLSSIHPIRSLPAS